MIDVPVSVIVVNYNAGPGLRACLRAIRADEPGAELIVVDNDSSDDSLDCLSSPEFANRVEIVKNGENLGFARAVNIGARRACAPALLILNPDCIVYPGAVRALLDAGHEAGDAGIVGGLVVDVDGGEQRGCRRNEPTPARIARRMVMPLLSRFGVVENGIDLTGSPLPRRTVAVDAVSGAFMLVARNAFETLGGFDEDYFLHFEDLDICRRARDAGMAVLFEPRALAVHLKSASGGADRLTVERHKRDGLLRYLERFHPGRFPGSMAVRLLSALHLEVLGLRERLRRRADRPGVDRRRVLQGIETLLGRGGDEWIVVAGASSQVGDFLLESLRATQWRVFALTRGERAGSVEDNIWWVKPEFMETLARAGGARVSAWIHLAPIWILDEFTEAIESLAPRRIVAVSSSSILTKRDSPGARDRRTVSLLDEGERRAMEIGGRAGAQVTIFRPSMLYGNRNNRNIETIGRWIRRFRFFPLLGEGAGKRQPLHAGDLAASCIAVLDNAATFGRIYVLAGGEVIEFKEMVRRVFERESIAPLFLRLPAGVLKTAISIASRLPGLDELTPEMVDRTAHDLVFDNSPARRDFGFAPRPFGIQNDR